MSYNIIVFLSIFREIIFNLYLFFTRVFLINITIPMPVPSDGSN